MNACAHALGKTGCGLCGVDSLDYFEQEACLPDPRVPPTAAATRRFAPAALHRAMGELAARQQLHHATGAVHAAGWADRDGQLLCVREDVGRHNALDKLVGALARAAARWQQGFVVVTSRASFEMVQKAARAGFGLLAAISAPTALAVQDGRWRRPDAGRFRARRKACRFTATPSVCCRAGAPCPPCLQRARLVGSASARVASTASSGR